METITIKKNFPNLSQQSQIRIQYNIATIYYESDC